MYFVALLRKLSKNAPLRVQAFSIVVSSIAYGVSILLLSDQERGLLTSFLYAAYLVIGTSFFGSNTMIAHWEQGPYVERLSLVGRFALPGLAIGGTAVLAGSAVFVFSREANTQLALYVMLFGAFIFLSVLGEAVFSAKTSSSTPSLYWQHYTYFIAVATGLSLLTAFHAFGALEVIIVYVLASIPFIFAGWRQIQLRATRDRGTTVERRSLRVAAAKLFVGTFASTVHIRLVGLAMVAFYGPEYLGKYLVLWLAFEVTEQLYKFLLLTEVHKIRSREMGVEKVAEWSGLSHVLKLGFPAIGAMSVLVFVAAPLLTELTFSELVASTLFLSINYLMRLILNFRLNFLRATSLLGQAARLSIANVLLAILLTVIMPQWLGFSGVSVGLALSTCLVLLASLKGTAAKQ